MESDIVEIIRTSIWSRTTNVSGNKHEPRVVLVKALKMAKIKYGDPIIIFVPEEGVVVIKKI